MRNSQEPQLKKASMDTCDIDINPLIDGSGIVLDKQMIGESILELLGIACVLSLSLVLTVEQHG